jgi:hypothetical protein
MESGSFTKGVIRDMSFDDIINDPYDQYTCNKSAVCNKEYCLHKFVHDKYELGRPEQPEDSKYEDNWNCTDTECAEGGCCIPSS